MFFMYSIIIIFVLYNIICRLYIIILFGFLIMDNDFL